jgi:IS66 Orf2 like protein
MRAEPRFVFVSERRQSLKVLTWNGTGVIVIDKLDVGRFELDPSQQHLLVSAAIFDAIHHGVLCFMRSESTSVVPLQAGITEVTMPIVEQARVAYEAANTFRANCLEKDGSLLFYEAKVWTTASLKTLKEPRAHHAARSAGAIAGRLSKFQDCLPEMFALEVIENYLLDVAGTVRWLGGVE